MHALHRFIDKENLHNNYYKYEQLNFQKISKINF